MSFSLFFLPRVGSGHNTQVSRDGQAQASASVWGTIIAIFVKQLLWILQSVSSAFKAWFSPALLLQISTHLGIVLKQEHDLCTSLAAVLQKVAGPFLVKPVLEVRMVYYLHNKSVS